MSSEDKDPKDGTTGTPGEGSPDSSFYDDPYHDESDHLYDDPYANPPEGGSAGGSASSAEGGAGGSAAAGSKPPPSPPPPPDPGADDADDEDDMARMSFLEHLEELRTRILRALGGLLVVYVLCLAFATDLLSFVLAPFYAAVEGFTTKSGDPIKIINIRPLEQFQVIYIKVPLITAVFLGAPWLMYQAWQFIAPGLYRKEKRWAVPFIFITATLFILGGMFCYFVALRVTLQFLLTLSLDQVEPYISVSEYLNLFIILEIGLGLVFQLPVLIFFFTLLRLTSPRFLLRNVRYAVLIMFVAAAIITPTGDPLTMTLFAGPMILLYFIGIGASWLLVLRREGRRLPWFRILLTLGVFFAVVAGIVVYLHLYHGYEFSAQFPWFGR
ncbi:MAG: twin-arginine translocase subunit TatC [Bryobacterales bacterium]|nr:twin-arginine translocase subunit TatC [Bryobacterales bacterium]